jgi:Transglycosylase-like domain
LKAPLIAVISVGIAAAAPAVAISAKEPSRAQSHTKAQSPVTDLHRPVGPVLIKNTANEDKQHTKLVKRFLKLRNRANRLLAKRDGHRRPRQVRTAKQVHWSNHALRREIRRLRKRIRRVSRHARVHRARLSSVLAQIALCESHGNPRAIGGGGAFRGKYQFTFGTWAAVGGKGDPASASESEQDRRAAILLQRSGSSPWPVCG